MQNQDLQTTKEAYTLNYSAHLVCYTALNKLICTYFHVTDLPLVADL